MFDTLGNQIGTTHHAIADGDNSMSGLSTADMPKARVNFSPRLGFNWDLTGDRKYILRGGSGLYTGRLPFVWIVSTVGNSNCLQSQYINSNEEEQIKFFTSPTEIINNNSSLLKTGDLPAPQSTTLMDKNLKMPQTWKSSLAFDAELPGGVKATVEGIYNKDITSVAVTKLGLKRGEDIQLPGEPDKRWTWESEGVVNSQNRAVTPYLISNTNQNGYYYSVTGMLSKDFKCGLSLMAAYTYSEGKNVTDGIGDQVTSETYPSTVTKLSFKYEAFRSDVDTLGVLEIEAYNHGVWEMMDRVVVTKKSKSKTAEYEFEEGKDIRAFRLTWLDNGNNSGMGLDAFIATTSQKINYIRKGKDLKLSAFVYGDTVSYTFGELEPATRYFYQVQTTDLDKGCEEHLTELSEPKEVTTIAGKPFDSKQLTIAYDSINYNPAKHAVYLTDPHNGDMLYFYNAEGRLVYSIPVQYGVYIYALDLSRFMRGETYMIQHASNGKLGRKNKWVKFIY